MTGQDANMFFKILAEHYSTIQTISSDLLETLSQRKGEFWREKICSKRENTLKKAHDLRTSITTNFLLPWFKQGHPGHWILLIRQAGIPAKWFQIDSLNLNCPKVQETMAETTLYNGKHQDWTYVKTKKQLEIECGYRMCLAAAMYAQKGINGLDELNSCTAKELQDISRTYVLETIKTKKCIPVENVIKK